MDYETFFSYLDNNELKKAMEYKNNLLPNRLYNYRALFEKNKSSNEKRLSTLAECKIWLSSLENLNDPFEYDIFFIDSEFNGRYPHVFNETINIITIFKKILVAACFTDDINNLPLWAHYANNHLGLCIEYLLGDSR